jgi:hypothetical protein
VQRLTGWMSLPPNLFGYLDNERKLRELLVFGQQIAQQSRRESALRGKREPIQINVFRSGIDAALNHCRQ